MVVSTPRDLAALYESDETAWLDATSDLLRAGRLDEIDPNSLAEYLSDMARRDRREVLNRLVQLLMHLLKWEHQPDKRTGSWQVSIEMQQLELSQILESATLRNQAVDVIEKAYEKAKRLAAVETDLPESAFPAECTWSVDELFDVMG